MAFAGRLFPLASGSRFNCTTPKFVPYSARGAIGTARGPVLTAIVPSGRVQWISRVVQYASPRYLYSELTIRFQKSFVPTLRLLAKTVYVHHASVPKDQCPKALNNNQVTLSWGGRVYHHLYEFSTRIKPPHQWAYAIHLTNALGTHFTVESRYISHVPGAHNGVNIRRPSTRLLTYYPLSRTLWGGNALPVN